MRLRAKRVRAIGVSAVLAFGGLLVVAPPSASAAPAGHCPPGQPPDRPPGVPGQPGNNANAASNSNGNNGNGGQQGRTPPGRPPDRPPQYPPGKCELGESSSSTAAGNPVTFSGSGYQSGETVAMGLNDGTSLGTVAADPSGSFTEPVVIPASTRPGTYQVMATGADQQLTSTLEVTPGTAVAGETRSAAQASRGSSLPFTGAVVIPLLALAAALLAAGAFMLRAARRRSPTN